MKQAVIDAIKEVLPQFREETLTTPPSPEMGDYALPCFSYAKELKKSPQEIAEYLAAKIRPSQAIDKAEAAGSYVNIFINRKAFVGRVLGEIDAKKGRYGSGQKNDTIIIDYSAPNVAKNMGIHNLRSTIIGNALYRAHKHLGYRTVGVNHLGDWGTQFGKLIWALERWSSPEELKEKGILFLNGLYVRYHQALDHHKKDGKEKEAAEMEEEARAWFKKIEDGDVRAAMWWKLFIDISREEYDAIYRRLGIMFDDTKGESFYMQFLDETIKTLKDRKLAQMDDGALVVKFDETEKMPPCLLKKRDGATLYGTRDIAAALYRLRTYHPYKVLYVVDVSQSLHFRQWFRVMELLDPKNKDVFVHVSFGRLSFPDAAMSTRKGNIIPLRDVLDKAREKALLIIEEKSPNLQDKESVAEQVGIGAVLFFDLSNDRAHNITFSWDRTLDFQGETSVYVQYTHARIRSILRKEQAGAADTDKLTLPEEYGLVLMLSSFHETLERSAAAYKPSILCRYLLDLCQMFNHYYVHTPVLKAEKETKEARLHLLLQVATVLKTGMSLLGIKMPDRM